MRLWQVDARGMDGSDTTSSWGRLVDDAVVPDIQSVIIATAGKSAGIGTPGETTNLRRMSLVFADGTRSTRLSDMKVEDHAFRRSTGKKVLILPTHGKDAIGKLPTKNDRVFDSAV
jgi:hypothetical protein